MLDFKNLHARVLHHVIDYTKEDFTKSGKTYDIVFNVVRQASFSGIMKSLNPRGCYLLTNPDGMFQMFRGLFTSILGSKKVVLEFAPEKSEDLVFLRELIEAGKLKSVIDRSYPLEEIAEAHKYVETDR